MTVVTYGSEPIIEQIIKQLRKLINVIKVQDLTSGDYVDREMALLRVKATSSRRADVLSIVDIFRGKIVDIATDSLIMEITGGAGKIEAFIELLAPFGILELIRTGTVALPRGKKSTRYSEPTE
jgi:acetolactate synthase-1/3 small subunit